MNEKDLERLKKLKEQAHYASCVCNPYEFQVRRDNLLDQVVEYLLHPLSEMEAEENAKKAEAITKVFGLKKKKKKQKAIHERKR